LIPANAPANIMRYREPLTQEQLQQAKLELRSYRKYKDTLKAKYPPRNRTESDLWHDALNEVHAFKAAILARDAERMNQHSRSASKLLLIYVTARFPGRS
jgi:hypothetical protein